MSLIDQVIKDVAKITTNSGEFAVDITFTSPSPGSVVASIKGIATKHHLNVDTDGAAVSAKNASVSFSEGVLAATGYPVRNTAKEVALANHRVDVADSSGVVKNYIVQSVFADEMVGMVVCILGDFE